MKNLFLLLIAVLAVTTSNGQETAAAKLGFKMQDHSLTIYGICEKQPCVK